MLFFFCKTGRSISRPQSRNTISTVEVKPTFHPSSSVCFDLYCFSISSSTCFNPSEFVLRAGRTSATERSTSTPFTMRKHFRSLGRGSRVSMTSLEEPSISPGVLKIREASCRRNHSVCRHQDLCMSKKAHLCSSPSCSISPIFCAICCRVFLKFVY